MLCSGTGVDTRPCKDSAVGATCASGRCWLVVCGWWPSFGNSRRAITFASSFSVPSRSHGLQKNAGSRHRPLYPCSSQTPADIRCFQNCSLEHSSHTCSHFKASPVVPCIVVVCELIRFTWQSLCFHSEQAVGGTIQKYPRCSVKCTCIIRSIIPPQSFHISSSALLIPRALYAIGHG